MGRVLFRAAFGALLLAVFGTVGWISFERSVVGRSILVPNLIGKNVDEARKIARDAGMGLEVETARARYDEKIPARSVLLQTPTVGSFVKPGQTIRVLPSLGPRSIEVPDLAGLSARAAALSLARASLALGAVSVARETGRDPGITSQDPPAGNPAAESAKVAVLVNRGAPERLFVMPDLIGKDAQKQIERLTKFGFRVGTTHYEAYEGLPADTILKQYPPAGYPVSPRDPITLTAALAPARSR
jgi:beta-lactam-binding protein with PASTA domain